MALVNCPKCEAEISPSAYSCPKCGHPLRKPERTVLGKIIKFLFIGFNVVMLGIFLLVFFISFTETAESDKLGEKAILLGMGLYAGFAMLAIWIPGTLILGLFTFLTRPKKY